MTTGLYTAATLSIDIDTSNAAGNLAALEARYGALLTALAGASGKATAPMQALATAIAEINVKAVETEKTAGAFTKLSGAIKGASDGIARSVKSSSGVVDTLNAKLQMTSRLVSRLNAEKLDLNLGASVDQSKAISLMNAKLASAFGQIEATGGGNTLASLEAAMRKQSELSKALASYRGESAAREAEELASQKRRFQAELKAVKDRQAAESSYTAWWASELKKREAEQMQSAIRSANITSKLTSRLSAEKLDLQLGSSVTQSKASSLMNAKLASAFGQIEATGGGNTLAALEASAKKSHEAMLAVANTTSAVATNYKKLTPAVHNATKAHDKFNSTLSDTHAFARGVSGSLGALWMTYGQVAPLLAGAAIGAAFKSSMGKGSEFEFQLTFVKALGEESAEAVGRLRDTALSLGENSLFGPVQLASGLRILAQAGLTADQSIAALRHTTDLATVGEMEMGEAAITLVGVLNAFKLSKTDFSRVGDVFAKAAAMSQSSVADMTNAMRTASVVGEQYGVSLEDTAAALTLLAQVNVKGTAAGTSFRNMMKELYSPVPQAAAMMKKLGVETSDAAGSLRPMADIIFDLKGKLEGFNKASQVQILQKFFGERGAKEAIAMLSLTREEWDKLVDSIGNADGFMRNVSAQLEATTKGVFIQAKNALEGGLVEAFERTDGAAHELAMSLRTLFISKEFKDGLAVLVDSLAQLAKIAVAVAPAVASLGAGFVVLKLLAPINTITLGFVNTLKEMYTAMQAGVAIFGGAAASMGALQMGFGGLIAVMARAIGPVGLVITALSGVYYGYKKIVGETPATVIAAQNYSEALKLEVQRLEQVNAELDKQIRLKRTGSALDSDAHATELARIDKAIAAASKRSVPQMSKEGAFVNIFSPSAAIDRFQAENELVALRAQRKEIESLYNKARQGEIDEFNKLTTLSVESLTEEINNLKVAATSAGKSLDALQISESRLALASKTDLPKDARKRLLQTVEDQVRTYRLNTLNSGEGVLKGDVKSRLARPYIDIIPELKNSLQKLEGEYSSGQGKIAESIRDGSKDIDLAFRQSEELLRSNFTSQINELSSARTKIEKELTGDARKKALDQLDAAEIASRNKFNDELAKLNKDASSERRNLADSEVAFEIFIGKRMQSVREQAFIEFDQKAKRQYDQAKAIISNATLHTTDVVEAAKKKLEDIALARSVYGDIAEAKTRGEQLAADVDATMSELRAKYENADKYGIFSIFGTFQQAEAWKRDNLDRLAADIAAQREKIATIRASGGSSEQLRDAEIKLRDTQVKFDELSKTIPKTVEKWGDDLGTYFAEGIVYGFKEGEKPLQKFKSMLKRSVTDGIAEALSKEFKVSIMNMIGGTSSEGGVGGMIGKMFNIPGASGGITSMIGEAMLSAGGIGEGVTTGMFGGTAIGGMFTGAGAALTNGAGMLGNLSAATSLIRTGTAGGIMTGIGMAAPYLTAALVIADAIDLFGKGGGPQQGQYGDISASGYKASYTMSGGDALGNQALAQSAYDQVAALYGMAGKQVSDLVIGQGYKLDPEGSASGVAYRNINIGGKTVSGGTFDGNNGAQWRGGNSDGAGAAAYLGKLTSDEIKKLVDVIGDSGLSTTIEKLSANFSDLADGIAKYAVAQATQKSLLRILMSDEEVRAQDLADANKLIKNSFDALGLALPTSTEGFRELVSGLDLTSLSGQNTLTKLAGVAEAFKLVADEAERTSQTRAGWQMKLDVLQGKYTQTQLDRFLELAGVSDEATRSIMQQVWALQDQVSTRSREIELIKMVHGESAALIETRADEIAALDSANAALQRHINVLSDIQAFETADLGSAQSGANTAYTALEKATNAEIDAINTALDGRIAAIEAQRDAQVNAANSASQAYRTQAEAAQSLAQEINSIFEALSSSLADLVPMTVSAGRTALASMRATAQSTGVLPDIEALQPVLTAVGKMQAADFATALDYARAKAATGADVTILKNLAASQKTQADANASSLASLADSVSSSVSTIGSGFDGQIKAAKGAAAEQIKALTDQLDTAKMALEIENGIYAELKSVVVALANFNLALANLGGTKAAVSDNIYTSAAGATYDKAADKWRAKGDTTSAGVSSAELGYISQSILNESGPMALYNAAKEVGLSLRDLDVVAGSPAGTAEKWAKENNLPTFANGGIHSGGFRVVGEKGWEVEATGASRVFNQDQLRSLMGGSEMVAELKALRAEVTRLHEDNSAENRAVERNTRKGTAILERVCPDGDALQTRAIV